MKSLPILLLLACMHLYAVAQQPISFCGKQFNSKEGIRQHLGDQFQFLKMQEGDTIVDIGAGSGWFEGALSAATDFQKLHFLLLDIDSGCLNSSKVNQMIRYYEALKGSPITHSFKTVLNTQDTLMLPLATYQKVWMFNMLHEVPDKKQLLRMTHAIMIAHGEIILLELIPKKKGALHGGCHKPLLSLEEWKTLFAKEGFHFSESILTGKLKNTYRINMARFVKD
jgi:ubiquinone/menaquinone biosynthesis C-methylase UbiE